MLKKKKNSIQFFLVVAFDQHLAGCRDVAIRARDASTAAWYKFIMELLPNFKNVILNLKHLLFLIYSYNYVQYMDSIFKGTLYIRAIFGIIEPVAAALCC